ncbi:PREDICTED: probable RNA-dependent RNA polymerase 3 isoform X1 [Nelumbo nucifera]|uniref:RNA-dependent RNA polymerase n=2 Tax=Nelumbo nucifera TaxID=4432 RepID=A0A822ZHJ4_NELNU|nr:PREDICTED: probable RNA-dependent RNA polymerase 3 isoform X1 [Nelumbo nucifera]DAD44612.1 TPA_asm: hypothetical protein HUJ06_002842 [Nelumbo nucifera]
MADPSAEVPLPVSVEEMLRTICEQQSLPPAEMSARRELALLGEEASLQLLRRISGQRIRSLTGFIIYMARSVCTTVSSRKSVCFSGPRSSESSVSVSMRGYDDATSHSPRLERLNRQKSGLGLEGMSRESLLMALGELEFRKAFLILSYIGKNRLEDVMTVETIKKIRNLPMVKFESEVWNDIGCHYVEHADRMKFLDWDSGKTYLYHCLVDPDGSYSFKGPYLDTKKTHLQRVLGDDKVLIVKFIQESTNRNGSTSYNILNTNYGRIAKEGILLGLLRYHFFVFKDGGKEKKRKNPASSPVKCYFVCLESNVSLDEKTQYILFNKSVHEARSVFMHVHTVSSISKYMARFSLILSKTIKLEVDLASVDIQKIEDEPCRDEDGHIICNEGGEPLIHTNGTGFISEDLALKCPMNVVKGKNLKQGEIMRISGHDGIEEKSELRWYIQEPPLLIQFRLFNNGCAVKGTFLVNKKLPPKTIQIRRSMIKVEADPKLSYVRTANSLEIVATSNQPRKSYLSKYLIALLNYGGVPTDYFMNLLMNALDEAQSIHSNKRAALKVALKYGDMDDFLVSRMILCGIPLEEPYLQTRLSVLMREERKGLKAGKIPMSECYYLMGTADPTGMLGMNEICVILDSGQISGKVLVYKNPGLHFGDIHVLTATYVKELESIVGNAKYAIFFPIKGPRSLADEMANSDFDGDLYWVSRNPQLLDYFRPSKPWKQTYSKKAPCHRKPIDFSAEELENQLFHLFLTTKFEPSKALGIAADSWLAFMDRLLTLGDECSSEKECLKKKMLQLVDTYYDALDAPKNGIKVEVPKCLQAEKFPHFMERMNKYNSTSVLGLIYDEVNSFQKANLSSTEVWKLFCFDGEVAEACMEKWQMHYNEYRDEMKSAMELDGEAKNASANEVIQKYKQLLYGAANFEQSSRTRQEIFEDSLAIYHVCYDYARTKGVEKCSFAWKVAGEALCMLYTIKQDGGSIICSQSILRELLS